MATAYAAKRCNPSQLVQIALIGKLYHRRTCMGICLSAAPAAVADARDLVDRAPRRAVDRAVAALSEPLLRDADPEDALAEPEIAPVLDDLDAAKPSTQLRCEELGLGAGHGQLLHGRMRLDGLHDVV